MYSSPVTETTTTATTATETFRVLRLETGKFARVVATGLTRAEAVTRVTLVNEALTANGVGEMRDGGLFEVFTLERS